MERPPSLNDYLGEREETPELFHEWETVLSSFQKYYKAHKDEVGHVQAV